MSVDSLSAKFRIAANESDQFKSAAKYLCRMFSAMIELDLSFQR